MIPKEALNDEIFDNLKWSSMIKKTNDQLDKTLEGVTIVGAEYIDYPIPDGVLLYLKDNHGKVTVLELGVDENDSTLYAQIAELP